MATDYGPLGGEFFESISLNELKITLDLGLIHKQAIASNNTQTALSEYNAQA